MAWFEGLTNLKGQLTNLAKGVLTDEHQDLGDDLNNSIPNIEKIERKDAEKDCTEWKDITFTADNLIDPKTVPLSSWSNEEQQLPNGEKTATNTEKNNFVETDGEVSSIISRGFANFFAHHISAAQSIDDVVEKIEIGVQTEGDLQLQIRSLTINNRRLQDQNASLTSDVASLSRVIEDLESQVAVSQDENANLSTGLEELDIQHQQAIEQVLVDKDETQKLFEVLQAKYNELECNFEEELKKRVGANIRPTSDACTDCDNELQDDRTEDEHTSLDIIRELEERDSELELVVCENARLREVLKDLKEELERQTENLPAIPENNEEVEALELRVAALENETSILREVRTNLETEVSSSRNVIEDLTRRLHISDAMIRNQDCSNSNDKIDYATSEQCGNELVILQDHCNEIESSLRSLELQYSEANAKFRRESEEKDRKREELERELEKLHFENAENRKLYIAGDEENVSLKKNICFFQSQLENMNDQLNQLKKVIEIKDKEMDEIVVETNLAKENFYSDRREQELNYERLVKDFDNLKNQINYLVRNVFGPHVQNCVPDVSTTSNFITELEFELRAFLDFYKKLETGLQVKIKDQESDLLATNNLITTMKEELKKEDILCQDLMCQISNLQFQIAELEDINDKLHQDYELEKKLLLNEMELLTNVSKEYEILKETIREKETDFEKQLLLKDDEIIKYKLKLAENESIQEKQVQIKINPEEEKLLLEIDKKSEKHNHKETEDFIRSMQAKLAKLEQIIEETNSEMDEMRKQNETITLSKNELQVKYDNFVEITSREAAEAETKIIKSFEEVNALKTELEEAESQLKKAIVSNNYGTEMCESIKEEFLKKIDKERSSHEEQLEKIIKEKFLLESAVKEETSTLQKELKLIREEHGELSRNMQMKIKENDDYKNEIEKMNSLLVAKETKYGQLTQWKDQEFSIVAQAASKFEAKLSQTEEILKIKNKEVESLKNQLEYVSQLLSVGDRQEAEGQPSADINLSTTMAICPNGCKETQEELSRLTGALLKEQTENKLLQNQVEDLTEKVSKSTNQVNRLQAHLLSVEDYYISELQSAQTKLTETQTKLAQADDRARNSSTAYTSANIRANQQVESLNQQLRLLTEHKEKLDVELSRAEDSVQRQNAAVTNLEAVLHQFQRDKQKDIDFETERLKQALNSQSRKNDELLHEIKYLQEQLNETKKGLAAANRLTEQLDQKSEIITTYKKQVEDLIRKLNAEEEKVKAAYNNCEGKIERNLMKNLLVGYVSSPHNSKLQVLNVLAQVLDLNKEERQKVGLESGSSTQQQQSLSEAFIRFLESESQPKQHIYLPLNDHHSTSAPASRKVSQINSGSLLLPDALPNLPHLAVGRNAGSILKDALKERNT